MHGVRSRKAPYAGRLGAAASSPSSAGAALAMMSFTFRPFSFLPLSSASVPPLVMTCAYVRGGVERAGRGADAGGKVEGESVAGVELGKVHHVDFLGAKPARKKA